MENTEQSMDCSVFLRGDGFVSGWIGFAIPHRSRVEDGEAQTLPADGIELAAQGFEEATIVTRKAFDALTERVVATDTDERRPEAEREGRCEGEDGEDLAA